MALNLECIAGDENKKLGIVEEAINKYEYAIQIFNMTIDNKNPDSEIAKNYIEHVAVFMDRYRNKTPKSICSFTR